MLDAQPDSRVVARCIDRSTLLEAIRTFTPDIAIFDISPFLGFESCVGEELEAVEECLSYLANGRVSITYTCGFDWDPHNAPQFEVQLDAKRISMPSGWPHLKLRFPPCAQKFIGGARQWSCSGPRK